MKDALRARLKVKYSGFSLDVDLALPGRGITALFGQSGSGKTTILRCIAGLETARDAFISVNGEVWQDDAKQIFVPTHKRSLGYVFQEASLFPHLSVRGNLDYGRKRAGKMNGEAYEQTLVLLGIEHLLDRLPDKLSGGESQRVAIARALLTEPKLLLMDEPLSALDTKRKEEVLPYIERIQNTLSIPILYVSHQPDEVMRLADHLVLLEHGRVKASGSGFDMLGQINVQNAMYDDASTRIEAAVVAHDDHYHLTHIDFAGGSFHIIKRNLPIGQKIELKIFARNVSLSLSIPRDSTILNHLPAVVGEIAETRNPAVMMVRLNTGGAPLLAHITKRSWDALGLKIGSPVYAQIKSVAVQATD
ncbi:MAG: molybdenum ABC transporter ATP-binding protein [Oxalobacter sp.]|nr:MAG: molybdenum ABC transporter ATP-binding protein [Oxalobacter sp.]